MITVNLTFVAAIYAVVHIVFGLTIHRRQLPIYKKYNAEVEVKPQMDREPNDLITNGKVFPLFLQRVMFGLPHRLLMLVTVVPVMTLVHFLVKISGQVRERNKYAPRVFIPQVMRATGVKDVALLPGLMWFGCIVTVIVSAMPFVYYNKIGWASFIPLGLYVIFISTFYITTAEDKK